MLDWLLPTHQAQLTALADLWRAQGATALSLSHAEQIWFQFSQDASLDAKILRCPIKSGPSKVWGELTIYGLDSPALLPRLQLDANFIGQLIRLESDLDEMTSNLVETQDQLVALYDLAQAMRDALDIPKTLHILAQKAIQLINAYSAFAFYATKESKPYLVHQPYLLIDEPQALYLLERLQTSGQRLVLTAEELPLLADAGVQHLLLHPLWLANQIAGFLGLINRESAFSAPEIKLSQAITDQAGAQLENVLLQQIRLAKTRTQTEMDLARSVQLRLLPQQLPQLRGLDIFGASYPALQVGGDFYDAILTDVNRLAFAVGDVSGKGMPSALLMAMTRTVTRNLARLMDYLPPAELLGRANQELYTDFNEVGMFVTLFVGSYDGTTGDLEYANAGHSPVVFCPRQQSAYLLEADGPPIGVLPSSLSANQHLVLQQGDILVAATDGFVEAVNTKGERFGYERWCQLIEIYRDSTAQTIAERLLLAVGEFSQGNPQEDDQTLIVMKGVSHE